MARRTEMTRAKERERLPSRLGALLEFTEGEEKGRKIPLIFRRTILGRKFGDILVRDIQVSATHVAIDYVGNGFRVVDLGSSNGTLVGGEAVRQSSVQADQPVQIGTSIFVLRLDPDEAEKIREQNPVAAHWYEGGLTQLIEHEFIHADVMELEHTVSTREQVTTDRSIDLRVVVGPDKGKTFSFKKKNAVIGRVGVDVVLADPDISRKHVLFERQEDGQVVLRDLASTNGTFVNDRRVSNCVLNDGDQIRVGQSVIVFGRPNST